MDELLQGPSTVTKNGTAASDRDSDSDSDGDGMDVDSDLPNARGMHCWKLFFYTPHQYDMVLNYIFFQKILYLESF